MRVFKYAYVDMQVCTHRYKPEASLGCHLQEHGPPPQRKRVLLDWN